MRLPFKLVAVAALLATTALPACAQPAPAPQTAASDADPALWVVKDEDTTIYLFGTVHVLKPGMTWFDEAVKTAFDGSQQLVIEMIEPEPAAMQAIVMAKATTPATAPTLTESLPADKRAAYAAALTANGIPAAALDRFDPWLAAVTLTMVPLMKAGYDPASGADKVLSTAAKAANKTITGLETAEQQIGFFDGLSQAAQVTFLTETVAELPKLNETMGTMIADWSKGDPEALGRLINEGLKESPETAKVLLYDRNARWAEWIDQRMNQPGTVFVAVGAGHLAGEQSVQDKLKAHKLTATRVKY